MNNTKETLIQMLHSVTEYDIIETEENGYKSYAIRNLSSKPALLVLDKLNIQDFPQWLGKSNN